MSIESAKDLAKIIMETIVEVELAIDREERVDGQLLRRVQEQVDVRADKIWMDYTLGKRDELAPTEQDLTEIWRRAGEAYTSDIFDGLVDKGLVEGIINEEGNIMYKVTSEGLEAIKEPTKPKKRKPRNK